MQAQSIQLEETIQKATQHFIHSDLKNWNVKSKPEKWSKNEILGHLIDSANNNIQRFVRGTYDNKFKVVYHQDEWVNVQHYNMADTKELISLWHLLNQQIVRILVHYPPDRKEILCDTGKQDTAYLTMDFLAQDYIDHLEYHLKQLYSQV
jgi:hypothetical protein